MNLQKIQDDFPIFRRKINNKRIIYLDNAATTQRPKLVIDKVKEFYMNYNANIHRGLNKLSLEASELYDLAKKEIANFINTKSKEIIFTKNTTESINLLSFTLPALLKLNKNDEIVISEMEHHSNIIPWQEVAKKTGAKLKYIPLEKGVLKNPEEIISKKTKIVSITHASNVLGTINNIKEIGKIAHEKGALFIVDAAQSIPHMKINIREQDVDFLVFSGHKMLAPFGIGVLYGKEYLLDKMSPFMTGGGMIAKVSKLNTKYAKLPNKFEAGTPNIAGVIGLSEAVKYLSKIGFDKIYKHEKQLVDFVLQELSNIKDVNIYGLQSDSIERRLGVISFNIKNINPNDVGMYLNEGNIFVRTGHHCAQILMKKLKVEGTVRASFYIYNSIEDAVKLVEYIKKMVRL